MPVLNKVTARPVVAVWGLGRFVFYCVSRFILTTLVQPLLGLAFTDSEHDKARFRIATEPELRRFATLCLITQH
jgi:hypothetical protein